jgi:hypothetical protein
MDKGLISELIDTSMIYSNTAWREMYINSGSTLIWVQIYADKYENIFSFQYTKLQDVVATVGGMMQMIVIFIFVVVMPFVEISYKTEFTNNYISEKQN